MLTDSGIQFTNHTHHKYAFHHIFNRKCDENGIEHRLTKVKHPWTNGQVERMNRTIKEPPSNAIIMIATTNFGSTSATSSPPTIWVAGSRR